MSLGCAASLSACGGGGGGSPAAAPAAQSKPQPKNVLIEVYGDSTALGCTVTPGASPGACQVAGYAQANPTAEQTLQAQLQAKYGSMVTVTNHGVAGNTIPAALSGDGVNLPWSQQMAKSKAQIVVFNFGINDSNVTSGESVAQFQANVSQLIQVAKAAGKTVVVETANPVNDPTRTALPDYVAAGIAAAHMWDVNVIDEFGYLSAQPTWPSMLSDNVHPTQAGYNLKAQFEFQVFDRIVQFAISH